MIPLRMPGLLALAALTALPAVGHAQTASTAAQTVDALNTAWGKHPGERANHAKGVIATGQFVASPAAAALSKAEIFAGKPVPVTVRFSDSTGLPTVSDGSPQANPHGLSIKFARAGSGTVDVATNSLAFFPVATGEEFLELLQASIASPPGSPAPSKLDQFVAAHPTQPWPADRTMADMGTLTLTKAAVDNASAAKQLRFLPSNLEPGIEVSDDPLIDARVRAYLISFGRRAS